MALLMTPEYAVEVLVGAGGPPGTRLPADAPELLAVLDALRLRWKGIAAGRRIPHSVADDAIQNAQVKLLKRIQTLRNPARLEAFAYKIFWNCVCDVRAKDRRVGVINIPEVYDPTWVSEDEAENLQQKFGQGCVGASEETSHWKKILKLVRSTLGTLRESTLAKILVLKFPELFFGHDTARVPLTDLEIAERLGLTHDAVRQRLKRWRADLRRKLEELPGLGIPFEEEHAGAEDLSAKPLGAGPVARRVATRRTVGKDVDS